MWGSERFHSDESMRRDEGAPEAFPRRDDPEGPVPDELIDAILDGDAPPLDQRALRRAIRSDEQAQARLDSTRDAIDALRVTASGRDDEAIPDLTASILGEVDRRRGLFGLRGLRLVAVARIGVAAAVLLAGIGLFVAHRVAPETVTLTPRVTPISDVVRAVPAESADAISSFRNAADSLRQAIASPVERVTRSAPCPKSWQCALHASVNRSRGIDFTVSAGAWQVTRLSPEAVWIESLDRAGTSRVVVVRSSASPRFTGRLVGVGGLVRPAPVTAIAGPEPVLADRGVVFSDR